MTNEQPNPAYCGLRILALLLSLASCAAIAQPEPVGPTPVIFDTDIGTDIDDAYALVALICRPELHVLGVTTVSGDAVARARLAAKLLTLAGGKWVDLPVYAGTSTAPQYMKQVEWAAGFTSASLHESGGVEFMRREIDAHPGEITLIAVGELTNIARLLDSEPGVEKKIRSIALMGGSINRGYAPGSKAEAEWNIKSNAAAAKRVFGSGIPLLVAPLDSTADLALTADMRVTIASSGTPLTDALVALNFIWRHTKTWEGENPILYDVLAVNLVRPRKPYPLTSMHLDVMPDGMTRPAQKSKPNAQIALDVDAEVFIRDFVELVRR